MRSRTLLYACALLILANFVQLAVYYSRLPDPAASHFGADGRADGWMSRRSYVVLMGALPLVLAPMFMALSYSLKHIPLKLINMPHREYWLAPERAARTHDALHRSMLGFTCWFLAFLLAITHLTLQANLRADQSTGTFFWWILGVFLVGVAVWTVRFYRKWSHLPAEAANAQS